jgi:hypothetical protein
VPRRKKAEPAPLAPPLTRAELNIEWCQDFLFIPEGKHVGHKLEMAEFMKDDFRAIYDNPAGSTRRAIISRGRKNAKTFEAAAIILLHLCGIEAAKRINSQLYSTALSRDQAALVFGLACKMVRMNPKLLAVVQIKETAKMLACPRLGTTYRALSAEAGTNFGLSPALVVHDDYHFHASAHGCRLAFGVDRRCQGRARSAHGAKVAHGGDGVGPVLGGGHRGGEPGAQRVHESQGGSGDGGRCPPDASAAG